MEKMTSGAKARIIDGTYGTAEAAPFPNHLSDSSGIRTES